MPFEQQHYHSGTATAAAPASASQWTTPSSDSFDSHMAIEHDLRALPSDSGHHHRQRRHSSSDDDEFQYSAGEFHNSHASGGLRGMQFDVDVDEHDDEDLLGFANSHNHNNASGRRSGATPEQCVRPRPSNRIPSEAEDHLVASLRMERGYVLPSSSRSSDAVDAPTGVRDARHQGRSSSPTRVKAQSLPGSPRGVDEPPTSASSASRHSAKHGGKQGNKSNPRQLEWRSKITEWCYGVADHFGFDRDVVSVAMSYLDRYVSLRETRPGGTPVASKVYQLSAVTALYLAIKLHAEDGADVAELRANDEDLLRRTDSSFKTPSRSRRRKMRLSSFVELSRGHFHARDITRMEGDMLETLGWRVNPPTPVSLVGQLLRLFPAKSELRPPEDCPANSRLWEHHDLVLHILHELGRYLSELSVCLPDVSGKERPSRVACAAILASADLISPLALPAGVREEFSRRVRDVFAEADDDDDDGSGGVHRHHRDRLEALKTRLSESFLPEMLADHAVRPGSPASFADASISASDASSSAEAALQHQQHPIALARTAGLLDEAFVAGCAAGGNAAATAVLRDDDAAIPVADERGRTTSATCVMELERKEGAASGSGAGGVTVAGGGGHGKQVSWDR